MDCLTDIGTKGFRLLGHQRAGSGCEEVGGNDRIPPQADVAGDQLWRSTVRSTGRTRKRFLASKLRRVKRLLFRRAFEVLKLGRGEYRLVHQPCILPCSTSLMEPPIGTTWMTLTGSGNMGPRAPLGRVRLTGLHVRLGREAPRSNRTLGWHPTTLPQTRPNDGRSMGRSLTVLMFLSAVRAETFHPVLMSRTTRFVKASSLV